VGRVAGIVAIGVGLFVAAAPRTSRAQGPPIDAPQGEPAPGGTTSAAEAGDPSSTGESLAAALEVAPGATCLTQSALEGEVQTWLGRDRLGSDLRVHVVGDAHDPRSVFFRIVRGRVARERRFAHLPPGCAEATAVVALAIALAIDVGAVPGLVAPSEGEGTGEGPRPVRVAAVQLAGGYQVLSAGSIGLAAGVELGVTGWLALRADLLGQGAWSNGVEGVPGVFDTVVGAAVPQVCAGGAVSPRVRLELCSGAGFGVIHVQGRGYTVSRGSTGSWIVATGGVRLLFEAGIDWALDVDGVFPIHTPAILADDAKGQDQLRAPNAAGALLSLGPAFTF
jgi:hypothetical protein